MIPTIRRTHQGPLENVQVIDKIMELTIYFEIISKELSTAQNVTGNIVKFYEEQNSTQDTYYTPLGMWCEVE